MTSGVAPRIGEVFVRRHAATGNPCMPTVDHHVTEGDARLWGTVEDVHNDALHARFADGLFGVRPPRPLLQGRHRRCGVRRGRRRSPRHHGAERVVRKH